MYYLSVDSGTKNLAILFYYYNDNYLNDINTLLKTNYKSIQELKTININSIEIMKQLNQILDNTIDIKFFKLINILDNAKLKETNIIQRSLNLKKELTEIDSLINDNVNTNTQQSQINLHIEYQMNINNKSLSVMNQIIYHYVDKYNVQIIYPAYKNKLYFHEKLQHRYFLEAFNSNYKSNKEHTKYNLLYFIYIFKPKSLMNILDFKKIDDIADTLCQSLIFI